jgi:hypothetical protein
MDQSGVDPPGTCFKNVEIDGNGSPSDRHLHKQVSQPLQCSPGATCSVSELTSYTIGWTADVGASQWISAGFSVTESWTSGDTYSCTGNPGDTVCVWLDMDHTVYSVHDFYEGTLPGCGSGGTGDPYRITSPNTDNAGGQYYCVNGDACRNDGDQYWDAEVSL